MKLEQVGAQLYTLRDFLETPEDFQDTLQKVAEIGFKSVELAGIGDMTESEVASLCAQKGLTICSCHQDPDLILNDPEKVIENLEEFGCRYAVYPYPSNLELTSMEVVFKLVRGLDASGRILRDAGKALAYHNHDLEFALLDGVPVLDIIYGESNPLNLLAELDTYWVHVANASPEAWCARLRDRLPILHLKDVAHDTDGNVRFGEVGSGILDFRRIIAIAEESGCQWFVVEQDTCPGDPFESLEKSFAYIRDNLVE